MRFFFYGTLIDEEVRRAVLGRHAPRRVEPARLSGWRRVAVPGKTYPVVLADARGSVDGVLTRGLTGAARRRLERYEDVGLYAIVDVAVVPRGRRRPVAALVFAAKTAAAVRWARRSANWSLAAWQRRDRRRLLLKLRRRPAA